MIHLSKSSEPHPKAKLFTKDAPTARLPGPHSPPSAIKSAAGSEVRRQRSAASRAGEPSCQPPQRSATAPETTNTPRQEGQRSPDPVTRISSAPPTIPKTARTPPHQPVDRGAPSVKQHLWGRRSGVNGQIEKSSVAHHANITAVRQARRERVSDGCSVASIWTCWTRTSVRSATLRASNSPVARMARVW